MDPGTGQQEEPVDTRRRIEELERVNEKYEELVEVLLDQIEGKDRQKEEYSYSFEEGWKRKREDATKDELEAEELDAKLREIKQLIDRYSE
ncbi:MAG: hypothetical protein SVU32_01860 [Candidatus Nanohaloarchaea archaeon]|nr:hypothetical protein [Candidatus Nanohaloarchaea archaeon]